MWFNQFRVGVWPEYFQGVQFSHDKEALNQYFRQMTPNTGPFDINVISDAMSAVVDKSGPAILFTHSQGGGPGWYTAMKTTRSKRLSPSSLVAALSSRRKSSLPQCQARSTR